MDAQDGTSPLSITNAAATAVDGTKRKAVMILATVPLDERHVMALWSELQCFTYRHIDHVLIAAPLWSESIIQTLLTKVKTDIPQFASNQVTISARFFRNDRYDVGLWCDAMETLPEDEYDDIVLLNDSLFALREFSGIVDILREHNLRMTSLNYVTTDPKGIWLESVFRGFDKPGVATFRNHSCVPATHPFFCPNEDSVIARKRCITENFEIAIARLYPPNKIQGLYLSDVPEDRWKRRRPYATWVVHSGYWRNVMVNQWNFPAAKVTNKSMIRRLRSHWLRNCTNLFDMSYLEGLDFSLGTRTIQKPRGDTGPNDLGDLESELNGFGD